MSLERVIAEQERIIKSLDSDLTETKALLLAEEGRIERLTADLARVTAERDAAQAKIDALMIEYCPDEMTPEQVKNWAEHQVVADLVEKHIAKGAG